jgi:hypothetical protein
MMTYNDHTLIFLVAAQRSMNGYRKKKRHVVINISVRDKKAVDK